MEKEKLIEVKDLQITFGRGKNKFVAVDHVNFDIYKGETFSLVGESGSGKTTIGRAIVRINPTSAGDIYFKGRKINGKISKEVDKEVITKEEYKWTPKHSTVTLNIIDGEGGDLSIEAIYDEELPEIEIGESKSSVEAKFGQPLFYSMCRRMNQKGTISFQLTFARQRRHFSVYELRCRKLFLYM